MDFKSVNNVIEKVNKCYNFDMLYSLEKELNSVGFALVSTNNGRMTLCRICEGTPCIDKLFDDYLLIGENDYKNKEISNDYKEVIIEFIKDKCSNEKLEPDIPSWQDTNLIYGNIVADNKDIRLLYKTRQSNICSEELIRISPRIENEILNNVKTLLKD